MFKLTPDTTSPTGYTTSTLVSFNGTNGAAPYGSLIADQQGNLYGTTRVGGANGYGTVFKLTPAASNSTGYTTSTLASFNHTDGAYPSGSLIADQQGNLYGTTFNGGSNNNGTAFKLTPAASSPTGYVTSTLVSFNYTNGAFSLGGLIADQQGNLYGAAYGGGANGAGSVFKLTPDTSSPTGYITSTLASFNNATGGGPTGSLIADQQGNLYGTTSGGGANSGGTVFRITDSGIVCYGSGTHLRLWRDGCEAEVPVEHLRPGDLTVTTSGERRPIRWIGHRTLALHRYSEPQAVMPVRIAAGAFGEGRPKRDLLVSPAHAIAVDIIGEVLIPACRLINGATITQDEVDTITYWHVELDSHDILLAEGLPAESYLDCGNRSFFVNAEAADLMTAPDARPDGRLPFSRPFHEAGQLVDLVRARLAERARALGWRCIEDPFAGLHLVANGCVIHPDVKGLSARFVVPANAPEVRLVSETGVPADILPGSTDRRRLGVSLAALTIDDGLSGARTVDVTDVRLSAGFHAVERDGPAAWRWTDGAAELPASLWAGCRGVFFLRVDLAGLALPRWVAPRDTASIVELADFRRRA
ncbi:MAG: Hint domain-containing protein [Methylobacterium sp.]|nr:choice-of-anchor tandem repeat GloVer-containing protein [Methylobacterium sp.]MBY0296680.1 Hint domain-containing protein [Methylobacterium sp.]